MTRTLPSTSPQPHLHLRALPLLISRLNDPSTHPSPSSLLQALQPTLHILAQYQLYPSKASASHQPLLSSTIPLSALLHLSTLSPHSLTLPLCRDAIIAYPAHTTTISTILTSAFTSQPTLLDDLRTQVLPSLVTRLRLSPSAQVVRVLHLLLRSHEEIVGLLLTEPDYLLPALRDSYPQLRDVRGKSDALHVCHALVRAVRGGQSGEALKRLMGETGGSRRILVSDGLREDYECCFEGRGRIGDGEMGELRRLRDEEAASDPRLESITQLFPHLPPHLLVQALCHPNFASTAPTPEEQAAPLVDAILRGGDDLPEELVKLKQAIREDLGDQQITIQDEVVNSAPSVRHKRQNIWAEEDLDLSRLRLGKDGSAFPHIGTAIPDHLRASILRLVESQAEEAEAQAAALREGHVYDDVDDDGIPVVRVRGDGEESGDEDESGDKVVVHNLLLSLGWAKLMSRGQSRRSSDPTKTYHVDQQTKLELAYLADPKVFDRDSGTRRGEARRKLKEVTGMDDAQLEGWRVMLDRNVRPCLILYVQGPNAEERVTFLIQPHKEAILARHQFTPNSNYLAPTPRDRSEAESSGGPIRGGGGNRGGRGGGDGGRGGGSGGRGGGGGGGRGGGSEGGRGRGQNKGSRGHSNAARTRGHDKKMSRMGTGA